MTDVKPGPAGSADGDAAADAGPPPNPNDVHLTINGRPVVAQKGELIIKAADDNGEYIPRFCYHNRMEPVGMCRMCICEVDSGRGPQLTPTCMALQSVLDILFQVMVCIHDVREGWSGEYPQLTTR